MTPAFFYVCISLRQIELGKEKKKEIGGTEVEHSHEKIVVKYNAPFVLKFVGGGRA